jgi:hypothetical protein
MFDVLLKDIVDLVLEVKTGALSFEAANPRARARMANMEGGAAAAR